MSKQKSTGSYYTPEYLAKFVMQYLLPEITQSIQPITFLEPSVGDGVFVSALLENVISNSIVNSVRVRTIERDPIESSKVESLVGESSYGELTVDCITDDFLEVQKQLQSGYRLICGNPPYLNKKRLTKEQIAICTQINLEAGLPAFVSNIWTAFVLRSAQLLASDGVMAFVLPAELLQVKYAIALKEYLYKCFERIEIFDFKELLFDAKGQGTVLFIGFKKPQKPPGIYFTNVSNFKALETRSFIFKKHNSVMINGFRVKESHYDLPEDDVSLLFKIRRDIQSIQYYATSKPGVVTAANDFFIISHELREAYNLQDFSRPIIQKGSLVNGKVEFTQDDFEKLILSGAPAYLLDFNEHTELGDRTREYLNKGEGRKIDQRYKCLLRNRWFDIPNISGPGEALFFKRCQFYPKLIKNNAQVLVTDSAYKIKLKSGYDLNSFIYSFYNSFTLAFAELEGRYYGGGVLELTPSEFKKLPLIYTAIDNATFTGYADSFKKKKSIEELLESNDEAILQQIPGVNNEIISKIKQVRQHLLDRRLRI
jgi:adenine-specific DNA-methyltransferase